MPYCASLGLLAMSLLTARNMGYWTICMVTVRLAVQPQNILVCGWCGGMDHLVEGMTAFAPEGSVVTIICECTPEVHPCCVCTASGPSGLCWCAAWQCAAWQCTCQ